MTQSQWPLHPRPDRDQPLHYWIKKLAHAYGVTYFYFCKKVLSLTGEEIRNLSKTIPEKALITLSDGTGIAVEELQQIQRNALALV